MRGELSWKVAGPVLALVLIAVVFFAVRTLAEPTVKASEIKAPPPPGGFPTGPRGQDVPQPE
ncbi:MAG: hypothetical protein BGO01_09555 [Armatimonadetes bacterium 55-13]|nr:MAG: hypothetical protein BGO01_09555 [Armatimonadetes bacterium 55-13]